MQSSSESLGGTHLIKTGRGVELYDVVKRYILHVYFGAGENQYPSAEDPRFSAYFAYYKQQCDLFLHEGGRHVAVRTHEDIADIVRSMKQHASREELIEALRRNQDKGTTDQQDERLERSVDLAARLFLMFGLGTVPNSREDGSKSWWKRGSAQQFLQQHFGAEPMISCSRVKLAKQFNAYDFSRIAGIEIKWTNNLADHLRIVDDDRAVEIFSNMTFLRLHENSDMFPDGFVEETQRTLALLLPASNRDLLSWVRKKHGAGLDVAISTCGTLRAEARHIERFRYWRDRLVVLKEVFDDAEPRTLHHWWSDRRRPERWYGFWVGLLLLVLGTFFAVLQCVLSALQVYKAFVPS